MGLLTGQREDAVGDMDLTASPVSGAVRFSSLQQLAGEWLKLWMLHAANVDAGELESSYLDPHEVRRAAMLARPGDRVRYMLAHVALRQFLGRYLGLPPEDVTYLREPCPSCGGPNGRPAVSGPPRPVHFSLSTSGELILIGIATAPVGVDVETLPQAHTISHVGELLHSTERTELYAAAPSEQAMVFARLWTRKEAYLKGVGMGVAHGLATEHVESEGRDGAYRDWSVLDVPVPPRYAAAAAVRTGSLPPKP